MAGGVTMRARTELSPNGARATVAVCVAAVMAAAYLAWHRPTLGMVALTALLSAPVAMARPDAFAPALVPLVALGAALSWDYLIVAVGIGALGAGVLVRCLAQEASRLPARLGWSVPCVAVLATLLVLSVDPDPRMPTVAGLPTDLATLLLGLALVAATSIVAPGPGGLARTVVLTGAAIGAYALALGDYASGRLVGLGLNPNYLGAALAVSLAAGVALVRGEGRLRWLIPATVCLVAIVQTHSRGALVAAGAGVAVGLISGRPRRSQMVGAAITLAACALLFSVANPLKDIAFGSRAELELSANNAIRTQVAQVALDLAVEHPLRGIGYGMFPFAAFADPQLRTFINTHNDYLRLAAESGVVALLLFLALLTAAVTTRGDTRLIPLRAVVATGAVTLLFANTLSNLLVSGGFWMCLGCLLAARLAARRRPTNDPVVPVRTPLKR
jgi:O-antigen ligase